jgi:hypothetical protein
MRPRDVLAQQLELSEYLGAGDTPTCRYLDGLARQDKVISQVSHVAPTIARNLANARAYLVTEQMTPLVLARVEAMHELTKVGVDYLPPRQCGFVTFEMPIEFLELRGRRTIIHTLAWGPAVDQGGDTGWLLTTFNDVYRQPDEVAQDTDRPELRRLMGRWHGIGTYWLPHGLRVGPPMIPPTPEQEQKMAGLGLTAHAGLNNGSMILALWGLLDETISTHTSGQLDRPILRMAARRKLPGEVTVIELRREAHPVVNPGSGKPLEERIWVDGFRRRYWCGSGPDRRQEWRNINGHWRGPEDGPVSNRPKVNRLSR